MDNLIKELNSCANPEKAEILQRFFKTGKGEYAEGDIFLGIPVPKQREISKKHNLSLNEIQNLLNSKIHEQRLIALLMLIKNFSKADEKEQEKIFNFYLSNTKNINNWDLVDLSAPNIVGNFLKNKDKKIIYKLANSNNLWEKRIAIISTFTFIRNSQFSDSLKIAEILLKDNHNLIHKAVGWMLREIGKRDFNAEDAFLKKHYKQMPRTMLRYAIEKFPENLRKSYLIKQP
jgi:3-methyladenine DNA glycosylase AlkD